MILNHTNSCGDCLHNKVCNQREKVEKVKDDIRRVLGEEDNSIEIIVQCKHYAFEYHSPYTRCDLTKGLYGDIKYANELVKKKHSK